MKVADRFRRLRMAALSRLFQTDLPAASSFVLGQRQIFILPSSAGLLYGLVLTVMYLGAVNYSLGLGHALVFLLAALGLTGMVHGFRNLAGLRLETARSEPVFASDIARFALRLVNERGEIRPALTLGFRGSDTTTVDLEAGGEARVELPWPAAQRGWLRPPRLTLSSRFPLGIFRAWSYPRLDLRLLVYPRPLNRAFPPPGTGERRGPLGSEPGDDDFAGFRPLRPGDPLRHVAWKRYARDGNERPLLVKQFSGAQAPERLFDWDATQGLGDVETRLSILAGWVLRAEEQDLTYALRLPTGILGPDRGPAHKHQCLKALALHGHDD